MDARLRSHSDILTGLSTLTAANKIVQRGRFIMVAEYFTINHGLECPMIDVNQYSMKYHSFIL